MTVIAVAVLLFVIAVGVVVIHRLNGQHDERIAAFRYSDALPGIGRRRSRRHGRPATVQAPPTETAVADDIDVGPALGSRGRRVMAILRDRKTYRDRIMQALYRAAEGDRLLGVDGAKLRTDLGIPEQDMAAACTYLAGEGWVVVDWGRGNTPAMITLTHQGIRRMESEEEARG
ncbi:hypothetical protein [Streptomyces thermodiastaticus]|uniref:hypothetical protein n=1 Tax=Streptomyces thermodiastaticus TaxID=44061 RepID=UPI0019ADF290|nr:hypothetical protein GCM10018787_16700 [Streptomyces thermodiastaticus]